jgi:hypothetical protein
LTAFPESLEETAIDDFLKESHQTKLKLEAMATETEELMKAQKIMGLFMNDFSTFQLVMSDAEYQQALYEAISKWLRLENQIQNVPMSSIDMEQLENDLLSLNEAIVDLQRPVPILEQVKKGMATITPYLEQLRDLAESPMHFHHWAQLFDDCGKSNSYYGGIKIDELIQLGILKEAEKIKMITLTARGESTLEKQFNDMQSRWKLAQLPVVAVESEDIIIGDTSDLFTEIADAQLKLYDMLNVPYVKGIKASVLALSVKLESF